ncbi:MAG: HEPN domain-containing protein [Gloeomargaritaceae cyanobacterium C42_A2020_066]|nr:HEPN domain-containing protein [Gloeomargaritaceae cyanobacterium C42_A2020_066]
MKPITQEWINKAEADFATAQRELQVQHMPNYDTVCFHAQECIEKYLKACLQENNIPFPETHDLSLLLELFLPVQPTWVSLRPDLDALTTYGVEFRYPGASANQTIANQAFQECAGLRRVICEYFAL